MLSVVGVLELLLLGMPCLGALVLVVVVLAVAVLLTQRGSRRSCPYCGERIRGDAVVCRYCGRELPATPATEETHEDEEPTSGGDPGEFDA